MRRHLAPFTLIAALVCGLVPLSASAADAKPGGAEPVDAAPDEAAPADAPVHKAADPSRDVRVFYKNAVVVRLNPLGLQDQLELDYRVPLYDPGDSKVLANNYLGISATPMISPATTRLGLALKFRPLNVFKFEVRWDYLGYFGNFGNVQSFDSAHADFSDSALDAGRDAGTNYATDGWQVTLDFEARAKVGPVVIRTRFKAAHIRVETENDQPVWYEQYYDLLLPKDGWFFVNDADVIVSLLDDKLLIGARWSWADVNYPDEAFLEGESHDTGNTATHRVGPLLAYRFHDEPGTSFNQPTILLLVNWYLKHRWRTGSDVSQAFPYIVLGFAWNGDLL